jgi:hypothetical protein
MITLLNGLIRLQNAIEGYYPEERHIVWYDVKATLTCISEKLFLKFQFQPDGYHQDIVFEDVVNIKTDEHRPHICNAQFFKTDKNEYLLYASFVMTDVLGGETHSWELVGKV